MNRPPAPPGPAHLHGVAPLFARDERERLAALLPRGETPLWRPWRDYAKEMAYLRRQPLSVENVRHAMQSLVRHGRVLTLEGATPDALRRYLREQSEARRWKPWTYNTHRAKLNSFFKYLWEERVIDENPLRRIRAMGLVNVHRPTLTEAQSKRILGRLLCRNPNSLVARRNVVFVHLLCLTGCRVSEALNMTLGDLDFAREALRIPATKGGKPRLVHIDPGFQAHLVRYLEYRHRIGRTDDWLLISSSRKGRWTYGGVRKMLARLSEEMGFKIHCHAFRRFAATQLAEQNLPLDQISQLLGHTNTRTTRLYINDCTPALLRPCTDALARVLESVMTGHIR